jgi:hypothetical protein
VEQDQSEKYVAVNNLPEVVPHKFHVISSD